MGDHDGTLGRRRDSGSPRCGARVNPRSERERGGKEIQPNASLHSLVVGISRRLFIAWVLMGLFSSLSYFFLFAFPRITALICIRWERKAP